MRTTNITKQTTQQTPTGNNTTQKLKCRQGFECDPRQTKKYRAVFGVWIIGETNAGRRGIGWAAVQGVKKEITAFGQELAAVGALHPA